MTASPPFLGFPERLADGLMPRAVIFGAGHGSIYPGKVCRSTFASFSKRFPIACWSFLSMGSNSGCPGAPRVQEILATRSKSLFYACRGSTTAAATCS